MFSVIQRLSDDLRRSIAAKNEELKIVGSNTIQISVPASTAKSNINAKPVQYIFQMDSAETKEVSGSWRVGLDVLQLTSLGVVNWYLMISHAPFSFSTQEWISHLTMAKLGLSPGNSPCWSMSENDRCISSNMPLFARSMPLNMLTSQANVACVVRLVERFY